MKLTPFLRLEVVRASALAESDFVGLWQLRRRCIEVQAEVPEARDYAVFREFFAAPDARVTRIVGLGGGVHGFLGWHLRAIEVADLGRLAIVDSDYFFVEPDLRGHVVMSGVALACYLAGALTHRCARVVIVGHGYPSSVMSGARFSGRVVLLGEAELEVWERDAMLHFAATHVGEGFESATCRVRMRTRPLERRRVPRRASARALLDRYEALNPTWEAGFGLVYAIHLTPRSLLRGSLASLRG